MKHRYIILAVMLAAAATSAAGELKLDGTLGQSQEPQAPAPFLDANGVATDGAGRFWTARDEAIYRFDPLPDGKFKLAAQFKNPHVIYAPEQSILVGDGEAAYFRGRGDTIYRFALTDGEIDLRPAFRLPDGKRRAWAVAPAEMKSGFGAKGKFFYRDDAGVIQTQSADGQALGGVFQYPVKPANAKWEYSGFGFEPGSGDLLIYSTYPDYRVYRYRADGGEVKNHSWPRQTTCFRIAYAQNRAWGLFNHAVELLPERRKADDGRKLDSPHTTMYPTGLAALPDGRLLVADGCGVAVHAADGKRTARLGGLPDVSQLALDADGTILAVAAHGERFVRLALDDLPGAPLESGANEPWRTGGTWTHDCRGVAALGGGEYLVLDRTAGQLWKFNPALQRESRKAWQPLTPAKTFDKAQSLAVAGNRFAVLAGGKVYAGTVGGDAPAVVPGLEPGDAEYIAMPDADHLVLASAGAITCHRREADGWRTVWSQKSGRTTGLAADADKVVFTDAKYLRCRVLNVADGKLAAELDYRRIPGHFSPRAVALSGEWIVVADAPGKRLLRLRYTK